MKLHKIIWPTVFSPTQSICPKSIRWKFFLVRSHCLFICRPLTNRRRESNPGRLGRKRDRFLCAMPSPRFDLLADSINRAAFFSSKIISPIAICRKSFFLLSFLPLWFGWKSFCCPAPGRIRTHDPRNFCVHSTAVLQPLTSYLLKSQNTQ